MATHKLHHVVANLAAAAVILSIGGCSMSEARSQQCFTRLRHSIILPDRTKVLANLTHGEEGRRIYDALMQGDAATVTSMLRANPALAKVEVTYDDKTFGNARPDGQYGDLMTFAVTSCQPEMLATLLDAGLPADGAQNGTALMYALLADTPVMAELLLQKGASPDPQKTGGYPIFKEVAAQGQVGGAMMLVRHGLDLKWVDKFGMSHLHTAVNMEQFQVAEVLINGGANPWLIGMGGGMPVQGIAADTVLTPSPENAAAKQRLQQAVQRPGLPWPPPSPAEVRDKVIAGEWPTAAMTAAGMAISPEAKADMPNRVPGPKY